MFPGSAVAGSGAGGSQSELERTLEVDRHIVADRNTGVRMVDAGRRGDEQTTGEHFPFHSQLLMCFKVY